MCIFDVIMMIKSGRNLGVDYQSCKIREKVSKHWKSCIILILNSAMETNVNYILGNNMLHARLHIICTYNLTQLIKDTSVEGL